MSQDRLDASLDIDRRSTLDIIRIIQQQDVLVAPAVAAEAERVAHAVDEIANRMSHGGRMFYVGAGTSGRIAMLDAAELSPTFGIDSSLVRVLMAGGERAYFSAVEGAEDDEDAAIEAIERNGHDRGSVGQNDRRPVDVRLEQLRLVIGRRAFGRLTIEIPVHPAFGACCDHAGFRFRSRLRHRPFLTKTRGGHHVATEEDLRTIALSLPGTEERPGYGKRPSWKVRGKASSIRSLISAADRSERSSTLPLAM